MEIAQELIDLALSETKLPVFSSLPEVSFDLGDGKTFLFLTGTEDYIKNNSQLANFLDSAGKNNYWVSVNKSKQDLIKSFEKLGIKTKNFVFLDSFSDNFDPKNLTQIQINLVNKLNNLNNATVVFDSISFLSIYHSTEGVRGFVRSLISISSKYNFRLILFALKEESDPKCISSVSSMVDKVIKA